jgi:hypothetical protein
MFGADVEKTIAALVCALTILWFTFADGSFLLATVDSTGHGTLSHVSSSINSVDCADDMAVAEATSLPGCSRSLVVTDTSSIKPATLNR